MKTIATLLAPVSDDSPCGEDLDEGVQFDRLRSAFDDNFPIDSGVSPLPEGEPGPAPVDWAELFDLIESLLGQTKDIYLAICYARCGIVRGDPDVVEQGLQLVVRLLEDHWDAVHPVPDDPLGRLRGPLFEDIARRGAFAMAFLEMPLVLGSRSSLKAGDVLDVHLNGAEAESFAEVRMMLDQIDDDTKAATATLLASCLGSLDRIDTILREKMVEGRPDFATVKDIIGTVQAGFLSLTGMAEPDDDAAAEGGDDGAADAAPMPGGGAASFGGAIKSRADVLKALNAIEQYYTQAEPGHPMRMAMGRLRGWVTKDFMEILEDIAPGSLDEVKNVLLERRDVE